MTPRDFFAYLSEEDLLYANKNYNQFDQKNSLKYFFIILTNYVKQKKTSQLQYLINKNIAPIISNNRFKQFQNFWKLFVDKFEIEIPKSVTKKITNKIDFFENFKVCEETSMLELEILIETSPSVIIYADQFIPIFKKYIEIINSRNKNSNIIPVATISKNVLLSMYGILLNDNSNSSFIRNMRDLSKTFNCKNTYLECCKFINERPEKSDGNLLREKTVSFGFNLSMILKDLSIDVPSIEIDIIENQKKMITSAAYYENVEEALNRCILSEDFNNVLKIIENKIGSYELNKNTMVCLVGALFLKEDLKSAKSVIDILIQSPSYLNDKLFIAMVLKKLLVRNKKFKNARSISKLIKEISE
jgi:hypothetical protein